MSEGMSNRIAEAMAKMKQADQQHHEAVVEFFGQSRITRGSKA